MRIARRAGTAAWLGLKGFYRGDDLTHAAAIAYYALLSFSPFFLLVSSAFGWAAADADSRAVVLAFVLRYFPAQFDFITGELNSLQDSQVTIGVAGLLALVWGALGVFGAITAAVNHAWGVVTPRSFWGRSLVAFLMLLVAGLLMFAAVLLVSASHVVETSWFATIVSGRPGLAVLRSVAVRNLPTLLFIVAVGFVYYFVPNARVRFRDVWIGALATGLLWRGAFELFSWYLSDMTRISWINGSIAAVVGFLAWVYAQGAILLYGVEFTAAYARVSGDWQEMPV